MMVTIENKSTNMDEPSRSESDSSSSDERSVVVSIGILCEDKEHLFSCTDCGKCFNRKGKLTEHQRVHTGEKPFSCKECGRCFNSKGNLVKHVRIHTGERPFSCPNCEKSFSRNTSLEKHFRTHTGEKPYLCSYCGKCFGQRSHLIKHHKVHSEETPFACTDCGMRFGQEIHLAQHRRIHTGEKVFPCRHCWKCFSRKDSLARHQIDHTGEKPFSCLECGKRFARKNYLTKHVRCHSGKPHCCNECGRKLMPGSSCECQGKYEVHVSVCADCGEKLEELTCFSSQCQKVLRKRDGDSTHLSLSKTSAKDSNQEVSVKEELGSHEVSFEIEPSEEDSHSDMIKTEIDVDCLFDTT